MTTIIRDIPLSKLVPSAHNVRRTGRETGIEELAASIAAHGLLQSLSVRPVLDGERAETGKYEVVGGGRRLAALKRLAKRRQISKSAPVPCLIADGEGRTCTRPTSMRPSSGWWTSTASGPRTSLPVSA
jgi:ParB-like chromosome segregation protein Spo0J